MQENNIIKLLNFEELIFKGSEENGNKLTIFLERKDIRGVCPRCGSNKLHINEWRIHEVIDLPIHDKSVSLLIRKQRYLCTDCNKKITANLKMIDKQKQHTKRVVPFILKRLKKNNFKDCSEEIGMSSTTVIRLFKVNSNYLKPEYLPKIIHIDEFKGNSNKEKYQLSICNGELNRVFDILENRKARPLKEYLSTFRNSPEVVVIDMWEPYYNVVKSLWKDVIVVADKFHYVRQISWAVRDVRLRIQKDHKKGKRIKKYWQLFVKNNNDLSKKQRRRLTELLSYDSELKEMYILKALFDKTVSNELGEEAHNNFSNWLDFLERSTLPEAKKLFKTFTNWYSEVVSSFYYNYSNGVAEGINNKIKVIKRQSYGIKKFDNLRNLIMLRIS